MLASTFDFLNHNFSQFEYRVYIVRQSIPYGVSRPANTSDMIFAFSNRTGDHWDQDDRQSSVRSPIPSPPLIIAFLSNMPFIVARRIPQGQARCSDNDK